MIRAILLAAALSGAGTARGTILMAWEYRDSTVLDGTYFGSVAYDVAVASDGSVYVAGTRQTNATGNPHYMTCLKLSSRGARQWLYYDANGSSVYEPSARAVAVYPISGTSYDVIWGGQYWNGSEMRGRVIRQTPTGEVVWFREFNTGVLGGIDDLAVAPSGEIYACGRRTNSPTDTDIWVARMAGDGGLTGDVSYAPVDIFTVNDAATSLAVDPGSGAVYAAGYVTAANEGTNIWVGRFPAGLLPGPVWTVTINGSLSSTDYAAGISMDPSGDIIVSGTKATATANLDVWVARFSPGGTLVWSRTIDGGERDHDEGGACFAEPGTGRFYVTGSIDRPPSVADSFSDLWMSHFSGDGSTVWEAEFRAPGVMDNERGYGVTADGAGYFYVCGYMTHSNGKKYLYVGRGFDLATARADPVTYPSIPHAFPNPFRPGSGGAYDAGWVTFRSLPAGASVRVYTLKGELVCEVTDQDSDGLIFWDAKNKSGKDLASGVYVFVVSTHRGRHSRGKVVIVR